MGRDLKYGVVSTERGEIPADEPVFVIRGKDAGAPAAIRAYVAVAEALGAGEDITGPCIERAAQIEAWQAAHRDRVRVPDTVPGQIREDGALGFSDDELHGTAR